MIDQMRADFPLAALWERWSDADQAEFGAVIRAAVADEDAEALACWSGRLAAAAGDWRAFCARVREAEARMRAAAQADREAAALAAAGDTGSGDGE